MYSWGFISFTVGPWSCWVLIHSCRPPLHHCVVQGFMSPSSLVLFITRFFTFPTNSSIARILGAHWRAITRIWYYPICLLKCWDGLQFRGSIFMGKRYGLGCDMSHKWKTGYGKTLNEWMNESLDDEWVSDLVLHLSVFLLVWLFVSLLIYG